MSAADTAVHYAEQPDSRTIDSIELGIGGRVVVPELDPEERVDDPGDARVLETDDPSGYLTVHNVTRDGNRTYEFCFRVDGYTATFTTLTRMEDGKDCTLGWIPEEVRDAIHHYHPNMTIEMP